MEVLETKNKIWGLWGCMYNEIRDEETTNKLWKQMFEHIQKKTKYDPEQVRKLMDSRWGKEISDIYGTRLLEKKGWNNFKKIYVKKRLLADYKIVITDFEARRRRSAL